MDATSEVHPVTLELHGPLAQRFAELGRRHGSRTRVDITPRPGETVGALLARLADADARYTLLYDPSAERLPEHVEAVLNDRVLDLQGGLGARLSPGDVLSFLPAHAGGASMSAWEGTHVAEGYGTIFRIRPKPGAEQRIVELMAEWARERQPKVQGALGAYLFRPENHPGELVSVAVFRDRESFRANGSDPAQDAWYRRLREQLEADPEWEDGTILFGASLAIS